MKRLNLLSICLLICCLSACVSTQKYKSLQSSLAQLQDEKKDSDGDGVPDRIDPCPESPGPSSGGCPDSDGDRVPDSEDLCPSIPGPATNNGCPLADADSDGVPDVYDPLPDQEGVYESPPPPPPMPLPEPITIVQKEFVVQTEHTSSVGLVSNLSANIQVPPHFYEHEKKPQDVFFALSHDSFLTKKLIQERWEALHQHQSSGVVSSPVWEEEIPLHQWAAFVEVRLPEARNSQFVIDVVAPDHQRKALDDLKLLWQWEVSLKKAPSGTPDADSNLIFEVYFFDTLVAVQALEVPSESRAPTRLYYDSWWTHKWKHYFHETEDGPYIIGVYLLLPIYNLVRKRLLG
ncbi:MAG: thrombospondin type 3 repeat-containing protein [Flavobacteriaceae bacterium]